MNRSIELERTQLCTSVFSHLGTPFYRPSISWVNLSEYRICRSFPTGKFPLGRFHLSAQQRHGHIRGARQQHHGKYAHSWKWHIGLLKLNCWNQSSQEVRTHHTAAYRHVEPRLELLVCVVLPHHLADGERLASLVSPPLSRTEGWFKGRYSVWAPAFHLYY